MRSLSLCLVLGPLALGAQQSARLSLAPANATLAEEFSNLLWARELKDGRLIVTDPRDDRIVVADLESGAIEPISRKGQGPGEYARALPAWSIGADSSVIIDAPRRWLLLDGPRVVATLAPDNRAVASARGMPRGVDARGHVYSTAPLAGQGRPIGDSAVVLSVTRASGAVDSIARIKALTMRQTSAPNAKGFFEFAMPTVGVAEEVVTFADGWLAIVRMDPYRVEWRSPDGAWTRGAPLPLPVLRMDDKEKRAFVERNAKMTGRAATPPETITDWPATVPPYRSPVMMLASPDGRVLIPRLPTADHPETRYDIVNRRGTLDGQLTMPSNERIVGFGATSAYVAVADDDGIQRLRRHPWPPVPAK